MTPEQHLAEAVRYITEAERCLRRTTVSANPDNWGEAATFAAVATAHAAVAQAQLAQEQGVER
jgi:hypothetical protein